MILLNNLLNVDKQLYQNVKVFENEKKPEAGFYKLIIAKDIGIVALIDTNDGIWVIGNNITKKISLNIKNGHC